MGVLVFPIGGIHNFLVLSILRTLIESLCIGSELLPPNTPVGIYIHRHISYKKILGLEGTKKLC